MDTGLKLHPGEGAVSIDEEIRLLDAAQLRLVVVQKLQLPAFCGGVHGIHAEEAVGEQGALLAAHAAANLHDDVLAVIGIAGQQQKAQPVLQLRGLLLGGLVFVLQKALHLGLLAHQRERFRHVGLGPLPAAEGRHDRFQIPLLLQILRSQLRIGVEVRLLAPRAELLIFVFNLR